MLGILDVLVATIAALVAGDEVTIEVDAEAVGISFDGTFLRRFDQVPNAINACYFTANFRWPCSPRLSEGAPAVLAGSGKVFRVWAEARKVMRVRPQSIVTT
jgi:hypothetical protein